MTAQRDLLLVREWRRPGRSLWLAHDLLGGDRILELAGPLTPADAAPGAILVSQSAPVCAALSDGGLALPEGVLWSLLDPVAARPDPGRDATDRLDVETALRREGRRFRTRIPWWRALDGGLRASCRALLKGYAPDLGGLLDLLDMAPVAGALGRPVPPPPPADPPPQPPVPPPADPEDLYSWFNDPHGLGAFYGEHFGGRSEQAEMARQVRHSLAAGQPLLVEAGTGVGKTLAYLVPLIATIRDGTRAVVSTHTRALQTQILEQDLPRLAPLLEGRRFALLMGRRNYLCLRQRQEFLTRPVENLAGALQAAAFRLWLEVTGEGLREELAGHPLLQDQVESLFDAADLCLPGLCYEGDRCFVQRARRRAREADLLVVNHSLLMHDLRAGHTLLGEVDHLVIDEAHRLPAVVLETHGVVCGRGRLEELEDLLGRLRGAAGGPERVARAADRLAELGPDALPAARACGDFGKAVTAVFAAFDRWWLRLGEAVDQGLPAAGRPAGRLRVRDKDEAFGPVRAQTGELLERLAEAAGAFALLAERSGRLEDLGGPLQDDLAQLAQGGQLLRQLQQDVHFLAEDPDEDWVTWLVPGPRNGLRQLGATLLEAGEVLREYWLQSDLSPILTSATLAVGEDFAHMLHELGLAGRRPATPTAAIASPFDYHRQVLVLTPTRFPAPDSLQFGQAVGEVLRELSLHVPRKTLGLFTSYRLIRQALEVLAGAGIDADAAPGAPCALAQLPGTAAGELMDRFRRRQRAVLLGTSTFWEGVDFPGEDLELLVVTKLPFLVPNDPWVEARCERLAAAGENPFISFMVRDAVLRLRQGFGRLIRRGSDRGVVLILDNRLHTKNYGVTFLGALPVVPESFADNGDLLARIDEFFKDR